MNINTTQQLSYETATRVASYLEMEWSDYLLFSGEKATSESAPPPTGPVIPTFYAEVLELISEYIAPQLAPRKMCDVGGATGRLVFEWLRKFPDTAEVVLAEPSAV